MQKHASISVTLQIIVKIQKQILKHKSFIKIICFEFMLSRSKHKINLHVESKFK